MQIVLNVLCMQEKDIENEEENFDVDTPARSSRALEWEALEFEDDEETSYEFDIIFDANVTGNLYENTRASSGKETHDLSSKTASSTLGRNETIVRNEDRNVEFECVL